MVLLRNPREYQVGMIRPTKIEPGSGAPPQFRRGSWKSMTSIMCGRIRKKKAHETEMFKHLNSTDILLSINCSIYKEREIFLLVETYF